MSGRHAALTALVVGALIATGCGSDDDSDSTSGGSDRAATVERADKADAKKPAAKSHRAQMVTCIENELGFDVKPDDDEPDNLVVTGQDGKLKANVVIFSDDGAARGATAKTQEEGIDAVAFGRAELIRRTITDTETGVIANCVAAEYLRPS